jgi:hypothetical protein
MKGQDSIRDIVQRNEDALTYIAKTLLELANEIKANDYRYKPENKSSIEMITKQLEDYIHVRCGTCTIRERLAKIEDVNG